MTTPFQLSFALLFFGFAVLTEGLEYQDSFTFSLKDAVNHRICWDRPAGQCGDILKTAITLSNL